MSSFHRLLARRGAHTSQPINPFSAESRHSDRSQYVFLSSQRAKSCQFGQLAGDEVTHQVVDSCTEILQFGAWQLLPVECVVNV